MTTGRRRWLVGLLLFTGVPAIVAGAMLVIRPDGSLLGMDSTLLADMPFDDWRLPGVLLATLVGVGGVAAGVWLLQDRPWARGIVCLYAAGLLAFELFEWFWMGPYPLEFVFAGIAIVMLILAIRKGDQEAGPTDDSR